MNYSKNIDELLTGIINQARHIHLEHDCGKSDNLLRMTITLRESFIKYIKEERYKLQEALDLLDKVLEKKSPRRQQNDT